MRIKDLGDGNYQTYPITDDMIEVDDIEAWVIKHTPASIVAERRIRELKQLLANTDYKVQKYLEGQMSEDEWTTAKAERQAWRDEINKLEEEFGF